MRGGFSFCGVDIADLGIEYAPEIEDTYVYKPATTNVHEETFDGHDGGYVYGAWKEPKEFTLRCLFEERRIDRGLMAKVYNLFRVGRSGKLVFQRRPWCYYYATVSEPIDDSEMLTYLNGTFVVKMKAYYPFARSDSFTCLRTEENAYEIMENTAMFDKAGMVPQRIFSDIQQPQTILLANPGTERAAVGISIAGNVGTGVRLKNKTNGQICGFTAITEANTTDLNRYVYIDSISGKTSLIGEGFQQAAYLYHESGFLTLEPGFPALREVYAHYFEDTVTVTNNLFDNYVGQFIFIEGKWRKILQQNDHVLKLDSKATDGNEQTTIMPMNEIQIYATKGSDFHLTTLEFSYKPTFA